MASVSQCPGCGETLRVPAGAVKVKCPECGLAFAPPRAGDDRPRRRRRDDDYEPDDRPRESSAGASIALILGVLAVLGSLFVVAVGGVAWLAFRADDKPREVAGPVQVVVPGAAPAPPPMARQDQPIEQPAANPPVIRPPANPGPVATGDLPPELRERVRRATALIRVEGNGRGGTGSGFVFRSNGDTAYLITNFHVVDLDDPPEAKQPDNGPFGPPGFPGRPPGFPRPPGFGPKFGPPGFPGAPGNGPARREKPRVTVVLESGTPAEQTLSAEVVAFDDEADLAALRVTGARNLPEGIDVATDPPVAETQPVYVFGFPSGNRTITIGKGTVAGLRRDADGTLNDVHINGEVNPGNSGGPVVDAQGRLIGVAVATVRGKGIGFAVPTAQLHQMFRGSVLGAVVFQVRQFGRQANLTGELWRLGRRNQVRGRDPVQLQLDAPDRVPAAPDEFVALARLTDPLHKVNAVTFHYAVGGKSARGPDGGWAPLAGAKAVSLKVSDQDALATFRLPPGSVPDETYAFQVSYADADGKTVYTQPHELRLTFPKSPKSVTLKVAIGPEEPARRYVEDRLRAAFAPASMSSSRLKNELLVVLDPIDDPKAVAEKLPVGEVTKTEGRTVTVTVGKVELPPPAAADVAAALADLKGADARKKQAACDKLGKMYTPLSDRRVAVAAALEAELASKDHFHRMAALRGLEVWAGPENAKGLIAAVGSDDIFTRKPAVVILGRLKVAEAAPAIAKLLPGLGDRAEASTALKAIGPPAEKAVIPFVSHQDGFTGAEACHILKEIGGPESIAAIERLLAGKPNFVVAPAANEALRALKARAKE